MCCAWSIRPGASSPCTGRTTNCCWPWARATALWPAPRPTPPCRSWRPCRPSAHMRPNAELVSGAEAGSGAADVRAGRGAGLYGKPPQPGPARAYLSDGPLQTCLVVTQALGRLTGLKTGPPPWCAAGGRGWRPCAGPRSAPPGVLRGALSQPAGRGKRALPTKSSPAREAKTSCTRPKNWSAAMKRPHRGRSDVYLVQRGPMNPTRNPACRPHFAACAPCVKAGPVLVDEARYARPGPRRGRGGRTGALAASPPPGPEGRNISTIHDDRNPLRPGRGPRRTGFANPAGCQWCCATWTLFWSRPRRATTIPPR